MLRYILKYFKTLINNTSVLQCILSTKEVIVARRKCCEIPEVFCTTFEQKVAAD